MSPWAVVFLGVIALASLAQTALIVVVALQGRRLSQRVDQLADRVERDLRPSLESLARIARNVEEIADIGVLQARRIDDLLRDTVEKIQETTTTLRALVTRPIGPLADITAFVKGVKRGIEVYQQLRGLERHSRGSVPRVAGDDDEHLFI